jgi:Cd2+/Zn2+-exporting ATPase
MRPLRFKIHGMDCAEEVAVLKREVGPLVGGPDSLAFDLLNAKMTVTPTVEGATPDRILVAVARTGMRAEPWNEKGTAKKQESLWLRWSRILLTAASGIFTFAGFLTHVAIAGEFRSALGAEAAGGDVRVPITARLLYGLAIATGIWIVLPKAWSAARRLRPDMNLLMVVAVVGAVAIGEWFEGATVAFLFALSLALEAWSVGRARRAVEALLDLTPARVRLLGPDNEETEVSPEEVNIGAQFVVRPGERIPLDGKVAKGVSAVNQAPITGESVPVLRTHGDQVFAGTVNGEGALEIESTKAASDTTLAHIVRLIGEAQSRRGAAEQWVEKLAQRYTPAVIALAVAVALIPPLLGGSWDVWFYRALVLLVIACPCALVISTPVSIVAALAAAARNGVLVKGGAFIEAPAHLRAIAFDKTGTLTEGKPSVVEIVPLNGHDDRELLERAAALEARSEHPLGKAVMAHARSLNIAVRPADDFQIIPGKGATGKIDGQMYWLGSHRYLEERKQESQEIHEQLQRLSGLGRSAVVVGNERHVCGLIVLADAIRPTARQSLQAIRAEGIERLVLLTGDNQPTADAVAKATGIDEVRAELLPADKVAAIEDLMRRYGAVAMVGDGVNDAPALARASIGIAMGAGTDAAIETADVALMSDDLTRLAWLVRHSRRTLRIIRQNIYFSLGVKAVFVGLTFVGFSSLWAAIAADMGASVIVIANGLRLLR